MTQTAKKSPFSMNVDLMHGPIFKNLLLFMLPIFISSLFQQLYNTVDTRCSSCWTPRRRSWTMRTATF